jgi:dihydroorotase (multifunctional complex type)
MQQPFDMAVTGGSVLLPDGSQAELDIGIRDGVFAALLAPGSAIEAAQRIDARGLLVMPGGLDVHVHLGHGKDISRPRVAEDAASETGAAAAGGLTAMVCYLMGTVPYENGLFDEVRSVTEAGARVDFGYHFIISSEEQLAGVPTYVTRYGAPSFKIFMNNRGGEGARLGLPDIDDGFLFRLAEAAAQHGGMVCPHPENIEVSWVLRDRAKAADPEGRGGLPLWNSTRPAFVEADAVQRAALLTKAAGAHLYVVHTSSAAALEAGLMHRRAGARVSLETCPHYLTHDIGWEKGDIGKINPPLRETADREALWRAVASGEIDTIASDHVHRDISSKAGGTWAASPGCPGLETLLPVLLSEGHHKRGIPLARIAALVSANPARLMGLTNKGAIAIGKDADLALVDLKGSWLVERSGLRSNAGYSIYEGWTLQGRVVSTIVRGAAVLRDGELVDAAVGTGRYVRRVLS